MTNINHKIKTIMYSYEPGEFIPIFYEGRLDNRNQFIAYKARRVALKTLEGTVAVYGALYRLGYEK